MWEEINEPTIQSFIIAFIGLVITFVTNFLQYKNNKETLEVQKEKFEKEITNQREVNIKAIGEAYRELLKTVEDRLDNVVKELADVKKENKFLKEQQDIDHREKELLRKRVQELEGQVQELKKIKTGQPKNE